MRAACVVILTCCVALAAAGCAVAAAPDAVAEGPMVFGLANVVNDPEQADKDAAVAAALGARLTRVCMYWRDIEPTPGRFNYDTTDRLVAACQAHGIDVQGQIAFPPDWAREAKTNVLYPPNDLKAWKAFVFQTVERYDGDGARATCPYSGRIVADAPGLRKPVRCGMVWMGVNKPDHFHGTAADYARVLTAAAEAVRAADPRAKVLVEFSFPPALTDQQRAAGLGFTLDDLLGQDPKVAAAIDVVAFAFGYPDVAGAAQSLAELQATLKKHKLSRPIWFNGFAQFFDGGKRPDDAVPKTDYLRATCRLARDNGIPVFIYGWLKSKSPPGTKYDFGLLNADGTRQDPDPAEVFSELAHQRR